MLTLPRLLALSFLARLPAVLWSRGYTFFDEQFQYLDPAYHLATGRPFLLTHEWIDGLRSWVYPGLLAGLLEAGDWLGLHGPEQQLIFVRLCLAVVSLLAVYGIYELVRAAGLERWQAPVALLAANNGIVVYQGVHPNGPALSCTLVLLALGLVVRRGRTRAALAGLALGLAFCCRPQDGLFAGTLFVGMLWMRRYADAFALALGTSVMILVQGVVDALTWGNFLHSTIAYVRFNLLYSSKWGGQSPWLYLGAIALVAPFAWTGLRMVLRGSRVLPLIACCALVPLLVHQVLDRRAVRFVTPSLVLVTLLWASGAAKLATQRFKDASWTLRASIVAGLVVHVVLFVVASIGYPSRHRIETALYLGSVDDAKGIVYHDLSPIDSGGAFYYRGLAERHFVDRADFAAFVTKRRDVSHVVARSGSDLEVPATIRLEALARFDAVWNPSGKHSYIVYRLQRRA